MAVLLPAHWQTAGILLGAWWCGAHIVGDPAGADITFLPPGGTAPTGTTAAIASLDPMGRDLGANPDVLDYVAECRIHPDDFVPLAPVPGSTPALGPSTVDETLNAARAHADTLGLTPTARVLSTRDWTIPDGLLDTLLAVLSAGASLVQVTHPDPAKLPRHRTTERTTHDLS